MARAVALAAGSLPEGAEAGEQGGAEATRRGSGDAGGAGGFPTVSLIEIRSP